MATPFSVLYQKFLNKITDYDLNSLPQVNLESIMFGFLESSIPRFRKCKNNLNDYDKTLQQFNSDLSIDEIEIMANWMKYQWLDQQVMRIELLKQSLSSKDFSMYSQANHLDKVTLLKEQIYVETNQMIVDYSYDFGQLDQLR